HKLGFWFHKQKGKLDKGKSDIYKKLSENTYVKKSLDEYIVSKETNKDKVKLDYKGWIKLLFEYVDENKCIPAYRTEHNGSNIGRWYYDKRTDINNNLQLYKDLSANKYIKQDLDEYIDKKN
ncbi:MAG: superfamily II helicase, partial [Homavirus sp.]